MPPAAPASPSASASREMPPHAAGSELALRLGHRALRDLALDDRGQCRQEDRDHTPDAFRRRDRSAGTAYDYSIRALNGSGRSSLSKATATPAE
jgi:hypothetical protein